MNFDATQHGPLRAFLYDLSHIAGRRGVFAAACILAGAVLEAIGISLLVPLLAILFGGPGVPHWLQAGAAAAFAVFGAHARVSRLTVLLGIFAVLLALRAIVVSVRDFTIFQLQLEFVETQQLRTVNALAASPWESLAGLRHARVSHLISADVQKLGIGIHFAVRGGIATLVLAVQCALAFLLAPALAAVTAGLLVAAAFGAAPMIARSRSLGDFVADANLSLLDTTAQFTGGLKLAVSQNLQSDFVHAVREQLQRMADRQIRFARQQAFGQSGLIVLSGIMGLTAVCVGLFWLRLAPALLVAFLFILARMAAPIEQLHQAAQQFTHLLAVYEKVRSFQHALRREARKPRTAIDRRYPEGDIVFENVTYEHPVRSDELQCADRKRGIRDLDLTVGRGEFLALTGPSGVGKTTIADLLAGLYEPQSGTIVAGTRVLGPDTSATWQEKLAYVPQDPFLFHNSIRANLSWANPDVDEQAMWGVLAMVGADSLVRRMERGLDSIVGERGALVSGGERQRIALARALLRNPRLIILDEATSALDGDSERSILLALSMLRPRPTIVFIAQRTENLGVCDREVRLETREGRTAASAIFPPATGVHTRNEHRISLTS